MRLPRAHWGAFVVLVTFAAGTTAVAAQDEPVDPTTTTSTTTTTTTTTLAPTTTTNPGPAGPTTTTLPDASTTTMPEPVDDTEIDQTALDAEQAAALLELQRGYDELVADEAETLAEYEIRLARVAELDAQLADLAADIAETEAELDAAVRRVERIEREQRANEAERRQAARDLDTARDRLRDHAIDAFVGGSSSGDPLDAVLDAENAHAAEISLTYAETIVDLREAALLEVRELEAALEELAGEIEARHDDADEARAEVAALEASLEEQQAGLRAERDRADEERVEVETALNLIRDRKDDYDRRLQTMAVESDNISTVLARAQAGQPREPIPLLRGPVDPTVWTSGFGPRLHPIFHTVRRHNGLDISGSMGEPIRSVDDGVVVMAELRNGFGNTIVIDHGGRLASVYAHLSGYDVRVGDTVRRGELIGRVGSTGWSTGPHLHLELRREGLAIDPAGHLARNEPIACDVLVGSPNAVDRVVLESRDDC